MEDTFMRSRTALLIVFALALVAGTPSAGRAQGTFFTPYIGSSFNSSVDDFDFGTKLHYGAALTFLGNSGIGFEVDFGYSPTFFESGEDEFFEFESNGSVTTLMGNLVLGRPTGLYASGGLGLMRSRIDSPDQLFDDFSDNGFGVNVGGGVRIGSASGFGVKGDLRYFRQVSDLGRVYNLELGDLSFWRATAGLSFGF
jgi:hypothetical protein